MFGRKEEKPKKRRTPRENLSQFGFMDMNIDENMAMEDDGGDDDLEAELAALTSDSASASKRIKARPKPMPQADLDKLVKESIRDVDDDDDDSVDENDPDLLGELNDLTGDNEDGDEQPEDSPVEEKPSVSTSNLLPILEERLKMYQTAEANAKSAGETSRARRFARGSKTILDQLKSVRNGGIVKEEDIPPPVATRAGGGAAPPAPAQAPVNDASEVEPAAPIRPAPPPPPIEPEGFSPDGMKTEELPSTHEEGNTSIQLEKPEENGGSPSFDPEVVAKLEERRTQYRQAAVAAKRAGNKPEALRFAQIVKQFDIVIEGVKGGQHADLSEMPPPPWEVQAAPSNIPEPTREIEDHQASSAPPPEPSSAVVHEAPTIQGPPTPKTIMEALEQRLELYQKLEAASKADGNSRKERQMGRIVKQYQDAIKRHKAGKPFSAEDLPTPPGYAPIPIPGGSAEPSAAPSFAPAAPTPVRSRTPPPPPQPEEQSSGQTPPSPVPSGSALKPNVRKSPASRQEKQMALLIERQKDFKVAAMQAKSNGELNQAKEYLRLAKGFDKLIEATQSGLPVDFKTLPIPPRAKVELEADFDIISTEDCVAGTDDEIYEKLVQDLQKQVQTCMTTRDHFKAMGDIASANRFENMAVHSKKDMDAVKHAFRRKDPIPKFHYETRKFNIVQCCTDLMDNDLELTIVQGINYNVPNPKDVDTYVRFELPWPSAEEPQKDRTNLVKDTNNPVYDGKFNLQIQRNVRACQRIFKRHGIKCEVWSRGAFLISLCCGAPNSEPSGFFRSDTLIGTATIKLQPLESKCIIHDSFDLMDGRKAVGGKLEVKVRLRNPIVSNQVEEVTEKWLIIDRI